MTDHDEHGATPHHSHKMAGPVERQASIPEHGPLESPPTPASAALVVEKQAQVVLRPKLHPRRSYSATDKEPEPAAAGYAQAPSYLTLLDLPTETYYDIFEFLDSIDGVCLSLTHFKLYAIHCRRYGKVPLHSRYAGPNDLEWAWRGAAQLLRSRRQLEEERPGGLLRQLRVRGQIYCRKCGISRCELHRHLKDWMGDGYEYCEICKTFGRPADREAMPYCFMSSPRHPHHCGRHGAMRRPASP